MNTYQKMTKVEQIVGEISGVGTESILSQSRDREISDARMFVWLILHDHLRLSYLYIGNRYRRHYSTIMHGVKKMRNNKSAGQYIKILNQKYPDIVGAIGFHKAKTMVGINLWKI